MFHSERIEQTMVGDYLYIYLMNLFTNAELAWNESIWIEIKVQRQVYLHILEAFYSPRTSIANFSDSL